MNKKILAGVMIGLLCLSPVLAQAPIDLTPQPITDEQVNQFAVSEMNAGITPDSGMWLMDRAMEKVRMAFTFGAENKIKYNLKLQEERTLEARQMVKEGNFEAAEKSMVQVRAIEQERNKIEAEVKEAQTQAEAIKKGK